MQQQAAWLSQQVKTRRSGVVSSGGTGRRMQPWHQLHVCARIMNAHDTSTSLAEHTSFLHGVLATHTQRSIRLVIYNLEPLQRRKCGRGPGGQRGA